LLFAPPSGLSAADALGGKGIFCFFQSLSILQGMKGFVKRFFRFFPPKPDFCALDLLRGCKARILRAQTGFGRADRCAFCLLEAADSVFSAGLRCFFRLFVV